MLNNCLSTCHARSCMLLLFILLFSAGIAHGGQNLSKGETVYISIYSHVYTGIKSVPFELSCMLSIRNTDMTHPIFILKADYYDSTGKLLEQYIKKPMILKPLASTQISIATSDRRGGAGANFIVQWMSENSVNQPIIRGIMLGTASKQGISFICPGKIITENKK